MSRSHTRAIVFSVLLVCAAAFLAGCKKDSSSPTGPGTTGSVVTVTGKVINNALQPVTGVPVIVTGKASVNTDANGNFTFSGVTTPYDATVIKTAYIYRRLTRADPTLFCVGSGSAAANSANVSGHIYPTSAYPEPAGRATAVALIAPEVTAYAGATGSVSPAPYSIAGLSWTGATTITATLYALQWDRDASNLPVSYVRYGAHPGIAITNGGTFTTVNDTMSTSPGTLTFSGSVTVPAGYTLANKLVILQMSGKTLFPLVMDNTTATSFSYKTPDVTGASVGLIATASMAASQSVAYTSGIASNSTSASLTLPTAPALSLPVDGAPGVKAGTQFSWNLFTGGVQVLYFNGPTNQPDFYIMTMAASDSLPDLATAGLPLPGSATYTWLVGGFGPFSSIDAAAGPSGFLPNGYPLLVTGSGSYAVTATRTFTTAP
jgi:hypothetical protein